MEAIHTDEWKKSRKHDKENSKPQNIIQEYVSHGAKVMGEWVKL